MFDDTYDRSSEYGPQVELRGSAAALAALGTVTALVGEGPSAPEMERMNCALVLGHRGREGNVPALTLRRQARPGRLRGAGRGGAVRTGDWQSSRFQGLHPGVLCFPPHMAELPFYKARNSAEKRVGGPDVRAVALGEDRARVRRRLAPPAPLSGFV